MLLVTFHTLYIRYKMNKTQFCTVGPLNVAQKQAIASDFDRLLLAAAVAASETVRGLRRASFLQNLNQNKQS